MDYKLTKEHREILEKDNVKNFNVEMEQHHVKIEHNIAVIKAILANDQNFKSEYPNLFKIVNRRVLYLLRFVEYSRDKVISVMSYTRQRNPFVKKYDLADKPCNVKNYFFFGSVRYLAKLYYGDYTTWNRNLNIFVTLGLVIRVPTKKIGGKTGRRALRIKRQMEREFGFLKDKIPFKRVRPTNFYAIPLYDQLQLSYAESIAESLIKNNFRANSFSKIYLIKVFGQEFANEVFPDERFITPTSNYVMKEICKFILNEIEELGYTTKDRVLSRLKLDLNQVKTVEYGFHNANIKAIITREFDRSISQIIDAYDLQYRKANKEIKEKLGLNRYQTIIMKGENT